MGVTFASSKDSEFRKEVSKLASKRNKRLDRLERNELTDCPRYTSWQENGRVRFGVKGKTQQEVQREYYRLQNFINAKTSTVRGAREVLKEIADNTGFTYTKVSELQAKSKNFFGLASKIRQYYNSIGKSAVALDYQKIWQQINVLVQEGNLDLTNSESIEKGTEKFIEKLKGFEKVNQGYEGYSEFDSENPGDYEFFPTKK